MKKLINKSKTVAGRLTVVDLILWGQMVLTVVVFNACTLMQEARPEYKVMINRGDKPAEVVVSDQPLKVGESVVYEGIPYIVVETY